MFSSNAEINARMTPKEYAASYRERNRKRLAYLRQQVRESWRLKLLELVGGSCCKDCENRDTRVLQFDHTGEKEKNVSYFLGRNWERAFEEAKKCDVVCANCHVIRTRNRQPKFEEVDTVWVVNSKLTCKRGHPKTSENYIPVRNTGYCKLCMKEKYHERKQQNADH